MLKELQDLFNCKYNNTENTRFYDWLDAIFEEYPGIEDNEVLKIAKELLQK